MSDSGLSNSRVLVTGANGFIGKNLVVRLRELPNVSVTTFVRGDNLDHLPMLLAQSDAVVHLAGENRPIDESGFEQSNTVLTIGLCDAINQTISSTGRRVPVVLASSTQAEYENPYGRSKRAAEEAVHALFKRTGNPCRIFRLPGVFGKWCKPEYNSVVATFCYNIARDLPIRVNNGATSLRLVYVDDVVESFLAALVAPVEGCARAEVEPEYTVSLSQLAAQLQYFRDGRTTLMTDRVGAGFVRALYATYISYLPSDSFSYELPQYADSRGVFVEMLKTPDSGQLSYFTAHPSVTRGGHYHHSKTEKFLVIKGEALFRFRHLLTNEVVEVTACGKTPRVIDTIPGWTHDITNVGDDEMIVMLWANENFDRKKPDTILSKV